MKSLSAPQKVVPRGKTVFCFHQFLSAHLLGMRSILRGTHLSFPLLPCLQRPVFSLTVNFSPCLKNQANLSPSRPRYSAGKESACNVGDLGSIPGLGRCPGEGNGSPLQYSGLENSMGCIYSPWGSKESDTTERLSNQS